MASTKRRPAIIIVITAAIPTRIVKNWTTVVIMPCGPNKGFVPFELSLHTLGLDAALELLQAPFNIFTAFTLVGINIRGLAKKNIIK